MITSTDAQVEQVEQPLLYCTHGKPSLFDIWINNKETPVPPVPLVPTTGESIGGTFLEAIGPTPPPLYPDQLYTGKMTGVVPKNWTSSGWLIAMKDRLKRTSDLLMKVRILAEVRDVKWKIETGSTILPARKGVK